MHDFAQYHVLFISILIKGSFFPLIFRSFIKSTTCLCVFQGLIAECGDV